METWTRFRIEIERIRKELKIPESDFRPVSEQEWPHVEKKIYATFCKPTAGFTPTWMWEYFRQEEYGTTYFAYPVSTLSLLVPPSERVWIMLEDRLDNCQKFWYYEGRMDAFTAVEEEAWNNGEVFIVSKKYDWMLCVNHHDVLMATGDKKMIDRLKSVEQKARSGT